MAVNSKNDLTWSSFEKNEDKTLTRDLKSIDNTLCFSSIVQEVKSMINFFYL